MKTHPRNARSWDESLYQLLMRVIDAVLYDQKPAVKIALVAEYLARTSRAELATLRRRVRKPVMRSSTRAKPSKR